MCVDWAHTIVYRQDRATFVKCFIDSDGLILFVFYLICVQSHMVLQFG